MARPDQPSLQTINILHVDDDLDYLQFTKAFLERDPKVKVKSTASTLEALRQLEASRFDCLLTDYKMPEKDGLAFAREIRSFNDVPIILLYDQGSEEVAEKVFQVGIDTCIRKEPNPAHQPVLAQNIQNIVERHRALRARVLREKQRLGKYSEKLEALHRHATTLAVSRDYTSVVETTLDAVEAVVGFHYISFMQRKGDCIQSIANRGAALLGKVFKLSGQGITARSAREKRTILVNDLRGDPDYVQGSLKSLSELAVPVVVADEVEVVINVENADLDAFTEEDRIILETLASHVASALQRLREQERQSAYVRSLEALHRHANRLAAAGSVSEVGESSFSIIEEVLGFNIGSFELVSGGYLEAVYTKGIDIENVRALPLDGPSVMVRAVNTGETQLVPDTRLDPDYVSVTVEGTRPRSELAVPVKVGGEVVVVINIESTEVAKFTEMDRILVEIMAQHVASVLEKMRRLEEVQEMERTKAREAVESVAKIGSMVRHDLRGPLAAIGNAAYLLKGNPEDTKVLEIIDRSVSRAAEILEDLRERTWTGSLTPAPTDLVVLIRETVEGLGAPERVNVALKLHDGVVNGRVDGAKIRRVLENLVLNAFDAMPDGGELSVEEQVNDGCLVLRVSDTGVGIPSESLGKLFTPFFTTKKSGTGLGLVYCRQVVEAHGGTISVESEAGRGTCFTVKLPLC